MGRLGEWLRRLRETWGWGWLESVGQDVRYALRTMRRRPGFTTVAVLSLALGLGANTAIFTFIHAILLKPLPVAEPERLVSIYHRSPEGGLSSSSYPDYRFYREHNDVFSGMAAFLRVPMIVRAGDADETISGELVSGDYFTVLGLEPAAGRWFAERPEQAETAEPLAVVSHAYWQRRFGGDTGVVGRSVRVGSGIYTITGVAPHGFRGLVMDWGDPPDFWIPVGAFRQAVPAFREIDPLQLWGMHSFLVAGRLRPGVSLERARSALAALSERAAPQRRAVFRKNWKFTPELYPAQQARFWPAYRDSITRFLALLAAGVGLILLIACLNLANLLLARGSQRQREIAVRLSIGSGRGRLMRQLLTESLILSLGGGILGLAVAWWTLIYCAGFYRPFRIPLSFDQGFGLPEFGFALLLALVTGLLFGLMPARQASRVDVAAALKSDAGRLGGAGRGVALRDVLVVAQVALSAILLAGAGLFLRTVVNARAADVTLRPEGVLVAGVDPTILGYDEARRQALFTQVLERVRGLAGVTNAALVEHLPLGGMRGGTDIVVGDEGGTRIQVDYNVASPGYFETVGLPVVRGRAFEARDGAGAPAVAVINEVMARRFWPGRDPLGQRFRPTWRNGVEVEVVGVVRDGKFRNFRDTHRPCFYAPLAQQPRNRMNLEVRAAGDPTGLAAAVRAEIRAVDAAIPLTDLLTLETIRERSMSQEQLISSLLGGLSALALALAAIGIYGVLSFGVAQRKKEIGIRMALGARAATVARAVLRRSTVLVLAGLGIGLTAALALGRLVGSLLYEVSPTDPKVLAGIAVALAAVAALAGYLPARRAARIDPLEALRDE